MVGKASNKEQEYFIAQEVARLKELRLAHFKKSEAEERRKMRELHYMRCAKCGQKMETTTLATVEIDICPDCGGVYLDAGELGKIVDEKSRGPFSTALGIARRLWKA